MNAELFSLSAKDYNLLLFWLLALNYIFFTFLMLFARVLMTLGSMLYWKQNAFANMKGSSWKWIFIVADRSLSS